jgi:hypothetical protein
MSQDVNSLLLMENSGSKPYYSVSSFVVDEDVFQSVFIR